MMKPLRIIIIQMFLSILSIWSLFARPDTSVNDSVLYSREMPYSIMQRNPERYGQWDYVTGTVLKAFQELWLVTGEQVYFDYVRQTVDAVVDENGHIRDYRMADYNIDEIREGSALLFLYRYTGDEKYLLAAGHLRQQMREHPRTSEGGFWHKDRYPHQMWLDGLYMASPFLAEYGLMFDEPALFDDVVNQIVLVDQYTYDTLNGLYYHGWDETRSQEWADSITGQSPSFWGRAMGWYGMAMVDVLDYLPEEHPGRNQVIDILQKFANGIIPYQDSSGVWWQVLDQPGKEGNYKESSVSAMFVYAIAKAIRLGYITEPALSYFQKAYEGILEEFITKNDDGTFNLTHTCKSAGLGYGRDGSYEYYVYTATHRENDGKGLGPFILAALEMENTFFPPSNLRVNSIAADSISLSWRDNSSLETGLLLERHRNGVADNSVLFPQDQTEYTDRDFLPYTSYRYHLKAFNASDTTLFVSSRTITTLGPEGQPAFATNPSPATGEEGVQTDVVLEWQAGQGTDSHDLYLGTSSPPPYIDNLTENRYLFSGLDYQTTYYWRVDEVNSQGITQGEEWSFTTLAAPQMVGHWTFNELTGTVVEDVTPFGNHGMVIGMDETNRQEGIDEQALFFNGIDQYVKVPHTKLHNFDDSDFSLSFWFRQDPDLVDPGKEYRYLIKGSHERDAGSGQTGKRYEVFLNPASAEFRFSIDDDITKSVLSLDMADFVTGKWVHVVAVRDRQEGLLKLYKNGMFQSAVVDHTGNISQEEDLYFGFCKDFGSHFHGFLDDVRIYNYPLNLEQADAIYWEFEGLSVESDPGPTADLVKVYPLPLSNRLYLEFRDPGVEKTDIILYGITGSVVCRWKIQPGYQRTLMLDTSSILPGNYILQIRTPDWNSQHRVVK
ncbi:MAG: glycoside hydrolase family 88 protein [Bacteroidales bacterium]